MEKLHIVLIAKVFDYLVTMVEINEIKREMIKAVQDNDQTKIADLQQRDERLVSSIPDLEELKELRDKILKDAETQDYVTVVPAAADINQPSGSGDGSESTQTPTPEPINYIQEPSQEEPLMDFSGFDIENWEPDDKFIIDEICNLSEHKLELLYRGCTGPDKFGEKFDAQGNKTSFDLEDSFQTEETLIKLINDTLFDYSDGEGFPKAKKFYAKFKIPLDFTIPRIVRKYVTDVYNLSKETKTGDQ